jgi:MYXO-CTERM domain-containing protein
MIKLATTLVLSAFAALLGTAGCSAGSAGDENVGNLQQPISCGGRVPCPPDDSCGDWSCNLLTSTCTVKELTPDGNKCSDPSGATGICVAHQCVAGCYEKGSEKGQLVIHPGTEPGFCGAIGDVCSDCVGTDTCTNYVCGLKRTCGTVAVPDDKPCTDNSGTCYKGVCCPGCFDENGTCQPGTAVKLCGKSPPGAGHALCKSCADSDACSTDICAKDGSCVHGTATDGTSCADSNTCDGAETCQAGKCTPPASFNCPSDGNACHAPTCDAQMNCSQKLLTGNGCPDGDKCNGDETCNNGTCQPGAEPDCDDKNPCTIDGCDAKLGCTHAPTEAGSDCDDGDLCNGIGACDGGGKCVVKPSQVCNDGNPCTDDVCVPAKGCTIVANTAGCNDGDPCTTVDKCSGGKCVGSVPKSCDDGLPCTVDTCTAGVGCTTKPAADNSPCNDGNNCNTGDHCVAGECKPTSGKVCDPDSNPCTTATCNADVCGNTNDNALKCQVDKCHELTQCANGVCPASAAIDCNDANPCTADGCDPATGCTHVADDAATCNDGDLCTTGDACKAGKCVATPVECMPVDDCHVAGECDTKTGSCDDPRAADDTECENGKGTCKAGKCELLPGAGGVGAGGEPPTGNAGEPTTPGTTGGAGGEATAVGAAGEGNPSGETGGQATGGKTANTEGGEAETPEHVFVRTPGGCSCNVPSPAPGNWAWLAGLGLLGSLARRRRQRLAPPPQSRGL